MSQLRHHAPELETLGVRVVVVTFETAAAAAGYVRQTGLAWPLLLDPGRDLYAAYGMSRGRRWQIWGPASLWAYARLLVRGRRPHRPTGDVNQLGGDLLVDPAGIVAFHHVGRGPADRPSVAALLAPALAAHGSGPGPPADARP